MVTSMRILGTPITLYELTPITSLLRENMDKTTQVPRYFT